MSKTILPRGADASPKVKTGALIESEVLGTDKTSEVIMLLEPASAVSIQCTGDLAGTAEFSVDGVNFKSSTPIPASNAIMHFTTNLVVYVKMTRNSGSGKAFIAYK